MSRVLLWAVITFAAACEPGRSAHEPDEPPRAPQHTGVAAPQHAHEPAHDQA